MKTYANYVVDKALSDEYKRLIEEGFIIKEAHNCIDLTSHAAVTVVFNTAKQIYKLIVYREQEINASGEGLAILDAKKIEAFVIDLITSADINRGILSLDLDEFEHREIITAYSAKGMTFLSFAELVENVHHL